MSKEFTYWTRVGKRIFLFIGAIILIIAFFKIAVFYMPFLIAFVIAMLIEPIIRKLMKKFKISRKISSIIVFTITFGIIIGILIWGIVTLISESTELLSTFNEYYNKAIIQIQNIINQIDLDKLKVSKELIEIIQNSSFSILDKLSKYVQNLLTKILTGITAIPTMGLYFAITVLALYFICTDKIYMLDELEHHLPEKWMKKINIHLKDITKILGGYIKAQAILILISFIISLIGLYIMYFLGLNVGFPLIIALGIAFVDALPILGSGTIMIPWGIISGVNGDIKSGIFIIVLWIIMSITRQFIEPKIVSGKIGVHPIFTIISMYTGFKFWGVMGMFIGPILLIILKNIFANLLDAGIVKTIFTNE